MSYHVNRHTDTHTHMGEYSICAVDKPQLELDKSSHDWHLRLIQSLTVPILATLSGLEDVEC